MADPSPKGKHIHWSAYTVGRVNNSAWFTLDFTGLGIQSLKPGKSLCSGKNVPPFYMWASWTHSHFVNNSYQEESTMIPATWLRWLAFSICPALCSELLVPDLHQGFDSCMNYASSFSTPKLRILLGRPKWTWPDSTTTALSVSGLIDLEELQVCTELRSEHRLPLNSVSRVETGTTQKVKCELPKSQEDSMVFSTCVWAVSIF